MQASEHDTAGAAALTKLGFEPGQVVQEFGWDDDTDDSLRVAIEQVVGSALEDEEYAAGADVVLLWHRDEDGDLADALVDALGDLVDRGFVVLCTPRAGHPGHVEPSEIEDAALTAGLHPAGIVNLSRTWAIVQIVSPRNEPRA